MFKTYLIVLLSIIVKVQSNLNECLTYEDNSTPEEAVSQLIYRLIGGKSSLFKIHIDSSLKDSDLDVFKIIKGETADYVEIYGSSGVAAAWGFHYYLKEYCNCHISWDGDQISIPDRLPNVEITVKANDKYRYYQNVCTTSYSFVWWNWTRWEREIDWMAINGINLALAFNGQEEIWRRVYIKLGLNDTDIYEHFTGPAFLSWNRMGNLRGWGGPLTASWHNYSVQLQKLILKRMRDLGITPVLPAFGGFVPRAFLRIYPEADVEPVTWISFQDEYCCVFFLSPLDDMFGAIGTMFLTEYIKEFGTNHIYNSDSFNEMVPPRTGKNYLRSVGNAVFNSMARVDKDAIWMMQGWLFRNKMYFWTKSRAKALLTSVPKGKMLILDLQAEQNPQYSRFDSFFGQPFIWCMLHNFGGTLGLHGNITSINNNVFVARNFTNSTMVGIGLTPEGINQNYVVYDLMTEMGWRKQPVNLTKWFESYVLRRYRYYNENATSAWILLMNSVYEDSGIDQHGDYIYVMRPSFDRKENVWYNKEDVWRAWDHMIQASQQMKRLTDTFLYDLVDITRQSLQLCLDNSYSNIIEAFYNSDINIFKSESVTFTSILDDMNIILGTLPHFLLGKWLQDAINLGTTPLEKHIYERNARNQITLWGPTGEINDYANKQWSGMVEDYYAARWRLFLTVAYSALKSGTPFDQNVVDSLMFKYVEEPFTYSIKKYPIRPSGDPVSLALKLHAKWRPKAPNNI